MGPMREIDKAFAVATKILFGKELTDIDAYENWFLRRMMKGELCKSTTSEKNVYIPGHAIFPRVPRNAVADLAAFSKLTAKKMELDSSGNETMTTISKKMNDIATYIVEFEEGTNLDVIDSTIYLNAVHAYKIVDCFNSKYIAYSFFTDNSEYVFATSESDRCKFSMNCYNSKDMTRSFEVDFCKNCADVMICHNCENVKNSLFCFNTKNKMYAIANVEVGREKFLEVREKFVKYVLDRLEKKHSLDVDIYNIGGR